jgi:hypothetical protein
VFEALGSIPNTKKKKKRKRKKNSLTIVSILYRELHERQKIH